MGHALARVLAAVVDETEAALHTADLGDLRDLFKDVGHHRAVLRRDIVGPADVLLRDHQHVHRRLRIKVLERQDLVVFIHFIGRDLPVRDFTKNAVHSMLLSIVLDSTI